MGNDVTIHVKWDDDGGDKFAATTKAKAKRAGEGAGDEFSGTFKGKLAKGGEEAGEAAGKAAARGIDKGGKDVDKATEKVAARTQSKFEALKFAGLSLGLPAAAAVGAAGTTLALTGIAAGFAGLGIAGVAGTDKVKDSVTGLKTSVVNDVKAMSMPLQDDVVHAVDDVGAAWSRLRPQVATATQGSAQAIHELTGAATDLAEGAMPGFVHAVEASGPALKGFRSFAGQAGEGLGQFATNVSKGSVAAGNSMNILGHTVETVESRLGTVLANLANSSERPLLSLDVAVDQITGGLTDMTAKGSGVIGLFQGFSSAGSGALTVLRGVASVAAALPPQVTQLVGAVGAGSMIMSKFGVDGGAGFKGLGEKIKGAEGAGGKFKTTMSGLASGALNPATLATAGLGIALLVLGADQERAASAAQKAADSQRNFTSALRESKGAVDQNVRASVAQDLATKNMQNGTKSLLDFAKQFGVTLPSVTSAVTGETGALGAVNEQLDAYAKANPQAASTVAALKAAIQSKSIIFQSSTSAVAAEAAATNESTEAQNRNRDAINGVTEAIYAQQNAQLGYRGAVLNSKQALDEYGKVSKDGKATEDDKAAALLRVEQAFAAQEKAAYDAALANSSAKDPAVKVSEALAAENREAVNLANSFKGQLPQSLQETIGKMSATEAQATGLKIGVNKVGEAVYQLPNGKEIKIIGNTGQAVAAINQVRDLIRDTNGKVVTMRVNTLYGSSYIGVGTGGRGSIAASGGLITSAGVQRFAKGGEAFRQAFADGGRALDVSPGGLLAGPGTATSDSIAARVSTGEFVVKASQTKKHLPLLRAINNGQDGFAAGGMVKWGDVSQAKWDSLYASGWRGNPTDGMEALYAPSSGRRSSPAPTSRPAPVTVHVSFERGGTNLEQALLDFLRSRIRIEGGNVQQVLGA